MKLKSQWVGWMAGSAVYLGLTSAVPAQVSADLLLDKLVSKGILKQSEAEELKREAMTNSVTVATNEMNLKPTDWRNITFNISHAVKSMELYGDVRMRFEYRGARLGPEAGSIYDTDDRLRYALRFGVRGELTNDFYYGLRLETSPNERSPWVTIGNVGSSPYNGPFSKSNEGIYVGLAYLGWHPTSWLDISVGRVPQPLYTSSMVWDSDYTPEGLVEKVSFTNGPINYFANFGQYVYQDVSPASAAAIQGGTSSATFLGNFSDQNAYLLTWQLGVKYNLDSNVSFKVAPVIYTYVGHGNSSAGFYGAFVGQGQDGFTFNPVTSSSTLLPSTVTASSVPGQYVFNGVASSYNQTGINNLDIFELPMELDFKLWNLDAKAFGDYSINVGADDRAREAYAAGGPAAFPGGVQLDQGQAMQFGLAVGNNLGLVYNNSPRRGTWEARAYWQHVEQYALDPNLLDSDFFEGRGNLQGLYCAFAYSFTDAVIGTIRYGVAQRINDQLGTGGFNADLPLPNPITRYQIFQADMALKF